MKVIRYVFELMNNVALQRYITQQFVYEFHVNFVNFYCFSIFCFIFQIAVNGTHFIQYIHRIDPAKVDSMSIEGDVSLQQVHVM